MRDKNKSAVADKTPITQANKWRHKEGDKLHFCNGMGLNKGLPNHENHKAYGANHRGAETKGAAQSGCGLLTLEEPRLKRCGGRGEPSAHDSFTRRRASTKSFLDHAPAPPRIAKALGFTRTATARHCSS